MPIQNTRRGSVSIAGAIIVAGIIVAVSLLYVGRPSTTTSDTITGAGHVVAGESLRRPSDNDHIRGNPGAKVSIVEFSDFECPFCARLHPTLTQIVDDFPDDVNWVYRHFPLSQIHSRALGAAVASECVARLGGNEAFWEFADTLFTSQHTLGDSFYRQTAVSLGIDQTAFASCTNDQAITAAVAQDRNEAISAGGRGTPFAVIITKNDQLIPFSGALPYENIRGLVEQALTS